LPVTDAVRIGGFFFSGVWSDTNGKALELGAVSRPPDGLGVGTLDAWSAQLWRQFSDYVQAGALNVFQCQIIVAFADAGIGPPAPMRWFADAVERQQSYTASYGLGWTLQIECLLAPSP
jgi:hypothetical protein